MRIHHQPRRPDPKIAGPVPDVEPPVYGPSQDGGAGIEHDVDDQLGDDDAE